LILGSAQGILMAQSKAAAPNLFTVVDLPKNLTYEQAEMVAKIEKYPNLRKVTYVDIADVNKLQRNGYLDFSIPDEPTKTQVSVRLKRLEVANSDKSLAYGSHIVDGQFSELMLNKDKGLVFGTMRHEDKTYIIYGIDKHLSAILELNTTTKAAGATICSTDEGNEMRSSDSNPPPTPELILPCQTETSVLVMFTTEAANIDPSVFQTAINSIAYYNTAIAVSQITAAGARIFSVGTELLAGFVETNDIEADVNAFTANATANVRRNATAADIVILLTNAQYTSGALGRVRQINAENPNAYAIVETLSAADPALNVFTHEVGHLFGGLHGSSTLTPAYAHGRSYNVSYGLFGWRSRKYSTVMQTGTDGGTRIPAFSNPNVSYNGGVTGDATCCNVARRIGETAPTISGFRNGANNFSSFIVGPDYINYFSTFFWDPTIVCGCAPYVTNWIVEFGDGTQTITSTTANDAPLVLDFSPGGPLSIPNATIMTITMSVTSCNGAISNSSIFVYIDLWGNGLKNPSSSDKSSSASISKTINTFGEFSPNPTSSTATFDYNLVEATQIKIVVIDGLGKVVKTLTDENKKAGYYQHKIDVSELNSGVHYLRIISDKQSLIKKILIQH
jgi:Secretion system C-terminal sorting domain/Metallo-peptidase family M12